MKLGDKVILFGFIDGCSYETTGQTNYIIALETGERVEIPFGGAINVDEIVFKDNIKLKDVIKRIKGFDDGTKSKWTYDILKELGSDFCSKMFHEAYQQGKLEGAWVGNQLKDADKIRQELNKPVIPQFVADWIEVAKTVYSLSGGMTYGGPGVNKWLENEDNQRTFALAWFDGYEIEKEKKYKIALLNRNDGTLYLVNRNAGVADKYGHFSPVVLFFTKETKFSEQCYELTKQDVVSNGFGWVFDCEGIQIEEVE